MRVYSTISDKWGNIPDNKVDGVRYLTEQQYNQQNPKSFAEKIGSIPEALAAPFVRGGQRNVGALETLLRSVMANRGATMNQQALGMMGSGDLQGSKQLQTQAQDYMRMGSMPAGREREITNLTEPVQFGKDVAAIGSWFAPGMLGMGKIGGRAVGGALGGAGYSKETSGAGIGGSAALGSITSLGIGALLDKLLPAKETVRTISPDESKGGIGRGLRKSNINPQVKDSPQMYSKGEEIVNYADDFGLKGTPTQQLKQINNRYDTLETLKNTAAKNSNGKISIFDAEKLIKSNMLEKGVAYTGEKGQDKVVSGILNRLLKYMDDDGFISVESLNKFKSTLDTGGFSRIARYVDMSPKQATSVDLWHATDDLLTNLEPTVKEYSTLQSHLYQLAPGISKQADQAVKPLGLNIKFPVQQGLAAQDYVARTLQGTSPVGKLGSNIKGALSPAAPVINSVLGKAPALPAAAAVSMMGGRQAQQIPQAPQTGGMAEGGNALGLTQQQIQLLSLLPEKDASKVLMEIITNKITGKGEKLSEAQLARQQAGTSVQRAIALLNTGQVNTGAIGGPLENLKSKFSAGDPTTFEFNTIIASLKGQIAKARAGTSFTPNEENLLNQYVPIVGDSMQQLTMKLKNLSQVSF